MALPQSSTETNTSSKASRRSTIETNLASLIEWYALWYGPLIVLCVLNLIIIVAIVVILCKRLCIEGTSDRLRVYRNMLRENAPLLMYPVMTISSCLQ